MKRILLTNNGDSLKFMDGGLDKRVLDRTRSHFIKRTNAIGRA